MNTKIKIFLASSSELEEDRKDFEILISRRNKQWIARGVFLELVIWEDFLDALSKTRLQDEYNKAIKECDIFVMLFFTKVGKYTEEEFETAFGQFKDTDKPLIFTYFKNAAITTATASDIQDDLKTLWAFQKKLKKLNHFQTVYENVDRLGLHFYQQLDKLAEKGIIKLIDGPQTKKSERIDTLHDAVSRLRDYCQVELSEGSDVGPSEDMLPKDTLRSPMLHAQHLDQVFGVAQLYLSTETKSEMEALIHQVKVAARLAFRKAEVEVCKRDGWLDEVPELERHSADSYDEIRDKAESCMKMLHRDVESSKT